jgi:protein-tyrosine phosphatase
VDWVAADLLPGGALGLTLCPGRRDRQRALDVDLDQLQTQGATTLVTLCTLDELEWAGVAALPDETRARGITWRHSPIRDRSVPSLPQARALVADLRARLGAGERVVLHCIAGLGRSGLVAAMVLVAGGLEADDAIAAVRAARDPRAVETREQAEFVARYAREIAAGNG